MRLCCGVAKFSHTVGSWAVPNLSELVVVSLNTNELIVELSPLLVQVKHFTINEMSPCINLFQQMRNVSKVFVITFICMKVFRIVPKCRILRLTFQKKVSLKKLN